MLYTATQLLQLLETCGVFGKVEIFTEFFFCAQALTYDYENEDYLTLYFDLVVFGDVCDDFSDAHFTGPVDVQQRWPQKVSKFLDLRCLYSNW